MRNDKIRAFEGGQLGSGWLSKLFGRPLAEDWTATTSQSFEPKPPGWVIRIRVAIPVAVDVDADRTLGMPLVKKADFDAFDAGFLAPAARSAGVLQRPQT